MIVRFLLLAVLLAGCAEDVPKPAVTPLAATDAQLGQLYKWGPGPWEMGSAKDLEIEHPQRDGALSFNVFYPQTESAEPLPVLLFSHGNWSNNAKYDNLIRHWVSHGYVVLAPLHMDGSGGYVNGTINLIRYGNSGLIQARVDDLSALLDAFAEIETLVPALAGRLDAGRIAATGHSFGAFNAQQLGGARAFDTDTETWMDVRDERIRAVVAVSPPGPMFDEIGKGSWDDQVAPTLMTTGTWDANAMFWPDWRMHLLSYETAPAGDQYALVVQGADHYLGNLICRPELEEPPQYDALAMVNTASVAFLDAYLKADPEARAFLRSSAMAGISGEFATLEWR
jgi:predicted dienelactone hydrolase